MDYKRFIFALPCIAIALLLSATVNAGVSESAMNLQQAPAVLTTNDESSERQLYIVQFADPPALAMPGRTSRLQGATSTVTDFDPDSAPRARVYG